MIKVLYLNDHYKYQAYQLICDVYQLLLIQFRQTTMIYLMNIKRHQVTLDEISQIHGK